MKYANTRNEICGFISLCEISCMYQTQNVLPRLLWVTQAHSSACQNLILFISVFSGTFLIQWFRIFRVTISMVTVFAYPGNSWPWLLNSMPHKFRRYIKKPPRIILIEVNRLLINSFLMKNLLSDCIAICWM